MFDAQCDVAALVYEAHQQPDGVLLDFVAVLKAEGQRPVGLVQFGHHNAGAAELSAVGPVPAFRFDDWIAYIEGMCVKLPCDSASLRTWWNGLAERDRTRHVQHNACEVLK